MRITYIHQHFRLPSEDGSSRGWQFAQRLAAAGHRVTVICGGEDAGKWDDSGVEIIRLKAPYANQMSFLQRLRSFATFMWRATITASRTPADVVFASSTPLTVAFPAIVAAALRRARFVFEVRDLWPSVPVRLGYLRSRPLIRIAQRLEAFAYRRASTVIALSPGMREGILQTAPLADVRVIPNASDFDLFDQSADERLRTRQRLGWNGVTVAYAGSFGDIYNIPWLVRLASHLPEVTFQFIGDGSAMEEARALADHLGLDSTNLLPGVLPKPEVAARIAAADFTISSVVNHPALHPASINKVFDAMAAGRPILFNHDGWLSDLVVQEGAGWRLDDDPAAAANDLRRLITGDAAAMRAGADARRLGESFDRDRLYRDFEKALMADGDRLEEARQA